MIYQSSSNFIKELEKNFTPDTIAYVSKKMLLLQEYGFYPLVYWETQSGERYITCTFHQKNLQVTFNLNDVNRHQLRIADRLNPGLREANKIAFST